MFRRDEVVVLLGAGASVDAGVPDSNQMVGSVEQLVGAEGRLSSFRELYLLIRSAVFYSEGLEGLSESDVSFNIERLVNVLEELEKKERHTLYPFVGAWNPKLQEVAGARFEKVSEFREEIIRLLRDDWLAVANYSQAAGYYRGLLRFQEEYGYPLRVFSLNYDLCVEEVCGYENVQRGFSSERRWDWRLFDETSDDAMPLLLYKLHGSADWQVTEEGGVTYSDSASVIGPDDVALIFGTSYKLQYVDPFLYLVYELRRWTLDVSRCVVVVGYGFNDDHINGILGQALRQEEERRLLAVLGPGCEEDEVAERGRIVERLGVRSEQVTVKCRGARAFLGREFSIGELGMLFPEEVDLIPEPERSGSA